MAAATALLAAARGKRVLLVEVDAKGNLSSLLGHEAVGFDPVEVRPRLHLMQMRTDASLREYLQLHVRVPVLGGIGPLANVLEFVANAAPGVKEILTVGKVCWEVHEAVDGRAPWDIVVVDAAASGHVIAQLDSPRAIRELVQVGRVRAQTEWMTELLADPRVTALNVVVTPEEMPVSETIELIERTRRELEVPLGVVAVNRVLPDPFTRGDESVLRALREAPAADVLSSDLGPGSEAVFDTVALAQSRKRSRAPHLARLRDSIDLPLVYLPYLFERHHSALAIEELASALAGELGA